MAGSSPVSCPDRLLFIPGKMTIQEPIDVIVPVYRGLAETRHCLESVLAYRQQHPYELIVIDDASPEPELAAYLDTLATNQSITLLRQTANAGFVAAINRGLALHPERDVVLLNSDTEVSGDWLDRLARCAATGEQIGTVTPFSNNATICSYPRFCEANLLPKGLDLVELDRLFQRANAGRWLEIPTGVGCCMYVRRACLTAVGGFDESQFGLGYGEENDFCMRASKAGWRHLLCADTFVHHIGGVSFSDRAVELRAQAQATLEVLHPEYPVQVQTFISQDPARALRHAVDLERARLSPAQAVQVVMEQETIAVDLWQRHQECMANANALERGLRKAEQLLEQAYQELRIRDQALVEAQQFVREREADIASLHEREQTIQQAFEQASRRILELEQEAESLRQQHGELQGQHALLNARLEQIYASKSWRYTSIFRRS